MSARIRKLIGSKIFQAVDNGRLDPTEFQNKISSSLSLRFVSPEKLILHLKVNDLCKAIGTKASALDEFLPRISATNFDHPNSVETVTNGKQNLIFSLNRNSFLKETLSTSTTDHKLVDVPKERIIVEYSSPNIAKPFHIGHLRSTIIGNFLANCFAAYDHNVVRINYLGDWGTQFGYLKLGMDLLGKSHDDIAKDPIKHLYNAYVHANRVAETDSMVAEKAREIFSEMENADTQGLEAWNQYRKYTVDAMERLYARLGVKFDIYSWESDYRKANILPMLEKMQKSNFIQSDSDGKQSFVIDENERRTILKSDGSTMYLTRDIAAIIDRQQKYRFDRMYYVAGNEQFQHFNSLFAIAQKIGVENSNRLFHVKFGRVENMSTRKGNVVFLSDILDEVRDLMFTRQTESAYTKIDVKNDQQTADILSVSALIAYELQRTPTANYAFDMQNIIDDAEASGKNFQITHCRLCNLEIATGVQAAQECHPEYLTEPEAVQLATEIARFPEVLYESMQILGAQRLLNYIFSLNTKIKKALKVLSIKNETDQNRQAQRMLLFMTAKRTLATCMELISVTPLEKM